MTTRVCTRCQQVCDLQSFSKRRSKNGNSVSSWCKNCVKINSRERYKQRKVYYEQRYLFKKYWQTLDERAHKIAAQNNLCPICELPLYTPCQDHNHLTGKVRDILCENCNRGLGMFAEVPERLEAAAIYLRRHEGVRVG